MEAYKKLLEITDILLGPEGCPWDREQTLKSIRHHLIEEPFELVEAIDLDDNEKIKEETADYLFNAIFASRLAEKEGRFNLDDVLRSESEKLIRRHPHVFGENKIETTEQLDTQWEKIKKNEKNHNERESVLDGIPKQLPSLAKTQKSYKKMKKASYPALATSDHKWQNEEELGEALWKIVTEAAESNLDAEHALRSFLTRKEQLFKKWESGD